MSGEIWVNVDGSEGRYQVSNLGNVKTTTNVNFRGRIMSGHPKILKQHISVYGYLYVYMTINRVEIIKPIHRLMAETFLPNPLKLNCVNHINCNKLDNSIDNLEWCTLEYNTKHAHENGRFPNPTGVKNGAAKITDTIALDIYTSKMPAKELATKHKVHLSRVYDVRNGIAWNHVTGLPIKSYKRKIVNK